MPHVAQRLDRALVGVSDAAQRESLFTCWIVAAQFGRPEHLRPIELNPNGFEHGMQGICGGVIGLVEHVAIPLIGTIPEPYPPLARAAVLAYGSAGHERSGLYTYWADMNCRNNQDYVKLQITCNSAGRCRGPV